MMSVGQPTVTDPNQVTTKPRQMPSGGGTGPGGVPGAPDNEQAPGTFDPAAMGADVDQERAEHQDAADAPGDAPSDDSGDTGGDEPPASFLAAVMPRLEHIATMAWDANPDLGPFEALTLAKEAMGKAMAAEGLPKEAYSYDGGAWAHPVGSPHRSQIPDLLGRGVDWLYQRHVQQRAQQQTPDRTKLREQHQQRNEAFPLRPSRAEEWLRLKGGDLRDKALQRLTGQPAATQEPEEPEAPETPQPPEPERVIPPPNPGARLVPNPPKTWGEWARGQIAEHGQNAARDLWHMRHDTTPWSEPQSGAKGAFG